METTKQLDLFFNEAQPQGLHLCSVISSAYKHTSCHWELAKDEIWLGNTKGGIPEHYRLLKTIRLGQQAYDIKGNPLDIRYYRPLIINKSEEHAYDKIYTQRLEAISRGRSI